MLRDSTQHEAQIDNNLCIVDIFCKQDILFK